MKRYNNFLTERKGEKAHKEAEQMGLQYKGFGYWVDPRSGQVTHKTEGDTLVPVEPDVETEKFKGGAEAPGQGMGAPGDPVPGGPPIGTGQNVGTAEPGLEQAPKRMSWEPGPDGDTCVDSAQPKPEVEADVFVGKTNYNQWTAGPDGTNYSNATTFNNYSKVAMEQLEEDAMANRKRDSKILRTAMILKKAREKGKETKKAITKLVDNDD